MNRKGPTFMQSDRDRTRRTGFKQKERRLRLDVRRNAAKDKPYKTFNKCEKQCILKVPTWKSKFGNNMREQKRFFTISGRDISRATVKCVL